MGADGGSYAHRSELIKTKARIVKVDKSMNREAFKFCTLSKRLLTRPVVADPVGKLYNKDAVLEFFIDKTKYGDGEQICGYLKGVKDIVTLNLTSNPTYTTDPSTSESSSTSMPFACPLSLKEMSGTVPFIAIRQCGCVFSEAAVRAVIPSLAKTPSIAPKLRETPDEAKPIPTSTTTEPLKTEGGKGSVACPNCGKDIDPTRADAVLPINPPEEVQEMLLMDLLSARAAAKANKKRKAVAIESVEGGATGVDAEKSEKKKEARRLAKRILAEGGAASRAATPGSRSNGATPALASNGNANSNGDNEKSRMPTTVKQKLAEQEQKRLAAQANMSEAVRSMFKPSKDMSVKDETTEFFGRTFNRYA